ncbi:MAG: hypothetical protein V7646_5371 [Pseudonocardia sp.]|jgi:hypothetical protein
MITPSVSDIRRFWDLRSAAAGRPGANRRVVPFRRVPLDASTIVSLIGALGIG